MAHVTMLRSKVVGNKMGVVAATDDRYGHEAHFQIYMLGADVNAGGPKDLPGLLIHTDTYEADDSAIETFKRWQVEAEILVAAGDM